MKKLASALSKVMGASGNGFRVRDPMPKGERDPMPKGKRAFDPCTHTGCKTQHTHPTNRCFVKFPHVKEEFKKSKKGKK